MWFIAVACLRRAYFQKEEAWGPTAHSAGHFYTSSVKRRETAEDTDDVDGNPDRHARKA